MNIMRKIVNQSSRLIGDSSYSSNPDHVLGLTHLKKLFAEINKPGASAKDIENNLYNMLPLFCKVFNTSSAEEMMEKFPDVLQFCNHVSRLMVNEIRRRASNQSAEAASYAIVKFLEIESTQEQSSGWMLLTTINLLASLGLEAFINGMTLASLPSTLVKCFYLFFDLPEVKDPDLLEPGSEFTPRERRVLLQKVFVQVLIRLCSYTSPAEELVRKDDLMLLFTAITSSCPPHNITWRKSAAEVLMTLSRHGLTPNVVQYIHGKGCVGMCIENMQRNRGDLSPIEMVEMLVTLFCFLKDSSEVSQMILDDFRTSNGYIYLSEFLLRKLAKYVGTPYDKAMGVVRLQTPVVLNHFPRLQEFMADYVKLNKNYPISELFRKKLAISQQFNLRENGLTESKSFNSYFTKKVF